mgnify:CR=1 FL=1
MAFLDEGFETIGKIKKELREEDNELKELLNKRHLSNFELDKFMAGW